MDPIVWAHGKYAYKNASQCSYNSPSRSELDTLHRMNQMCTASTDENSFVMSHDESIELLQETYSGSMQITEDLKIGDWQAASHLYHANGVNVDPVKFGTTQAELEKLRDGFISYTRKRYKLPSIGYVKACQTSLKTICLDCSSIRRDDTEYFYKHSVSKSVTFQNGRYLICFNGTTKDLITGDKQREETMRKFNQTNRIGSQEWIDKWSK